MAFHNDLSDQISHSMQRMCKATVLDEITMKICLIKISRALLDADVATVLVNNMERNIQKYINTFLLDAKTEKSFSEESQQIQAWNCDYKRVQYMILEKATDSRKGSGKQPIQKLRLNFQRVMCRVAAFNELCKMLDPGKSELACYLGLNPAKVARQGIEKFRKENRDLIIVDTNSRHNHYSTSLFEEMSQIAKIMKPDVVLVMDSRIGQAASAQAFKESFHDGSVILTNIRGNTKATGALS
ncbi:predicted protein, partial [Arabidopsis lyrata subsp. lyrata]